MVHVMPIASDARDAPFTNEPGIVIELCIDEHPNDPNRVIVSAMDRDTHRPIAVTDRPDICDAVTGHLAMLAGFAFVLGDDDAARARAGRGAKATKVEQAAQEFLTTIGAKAKS